MRHRTNNRVSHIRCKDVALSFAKRRALLIQEAAAEGLTVLHDDGQQFRAEKINKSRQRIVYQACVQGAPFANGPAIIKDVGAVQYADLLLPKAAQ